MLKRPSVVCFDMFGCINLNLPSPPSTILETSSARSSFSTLFSTHFTGFLPSLGSESLPSAAREQSGWEEGGRGGRLASLERRGGGENGEDAGSYSRTEHGQQTVRQCLLIIDSQMLLSISGLCNGSIKLARGSGSVWMRAALAL